MDFDENLVDKLGENSPRASEPVLSLPRLSQLRARTLAVAAILVATLATSLWRFAHAPPVGTYDAQARAALASMLGLPPPPSLEDDRIARTPGFDRHANERPWTREEFVTHLVGLPATAVHLRYDLVMLQQHRGSLDIWLCSDGRRTMSWQLALPRPEASAQPSPVRTLVADARGVWSNVNSDEAKGWLPLLNSSAHAVSTLAQAYEALDPTSQREVNLGVSQWRDELNRARGEEPGHTDEVAQQRCAVVQWGSQTICLWEEVGAVLRYEGPRFGVTATAIRLIDDAALAEQQCTPGDDLHRLIAWQEREELRPEASAPADSELRKLLANAAEEREGLHQAARHSLEALALGNYAPLALLLAGQPVSPATPQETRERPL